MANPSASHRMQSQPHSAFQAHEKGNCLPAAQSDALTINPKPIAEAEEKLGPNARVRWTTSITLSQKHGLATT
jgi:hypothetical protein